MWLMSSRSGVATLRTAIHLLLTYLLGSERLRISGTGFRVTQQTVSQHRMGCESVPIQLAQCWFLGWPFPMLKYNYIFQIKYTEAILSDSTRKLL